uniref:Uncharacterized protein n=1 Tax=Rhizophora mucronata TaxID=61149 RepID=A0A2P2P4E9_RHIMU
MYIVLLAVTALHWVQASIYGKLYFPLGMEQEG